TSHLWTPVPDFRGTFYGRGFKIKHLTINDGGADYQGLFGNLDSGADVHDLGLTDVNIIAGHYVGALAGLVGTATITNCYSTGYINGNSNMGGLVGGADNAALTISYSWSSCSVTARTASDNDHAGGFFGPLWNGTVTITNCYSTGDVLGYGNSGAFAALSYHGALTISNCYSTGNVTTHNTYWNNVGGIVGLAGPSATVTVSNSYHSGLVSGADDVGKTGGIIGGLDGGSSVSVTNSYYNSANASGQGGGTATSTSDMKTASFVTTLNASQSPAPWRADTLNSNSGYPVLNGMPGLMSFISQTQMPLGTWIVSNPVTVDFITDSRPISITGGEFSISTDSGSTWGSWTSPTGTISAGNVVMVRQTSSSNYSTMTTATLDIGGFTSDFDVTTAASGDPNANGLVSWWKAENNGYDAVSGNHGTAMNGATYAAGKTGQAFSFDGVDDYINVPHNDNLGNSATNQTFSFWLYFNSIPSDYRNIVEKGVGGSYAVAYNIRTHSSTGLELQYCNTHRCYIMNETYSSLGISEGNWYHIAYVIDDTNQMAYMYFNGIPKDNTSGYFNPSTPGDTAPLKFGGHTWDGYFPGLLDEIKFFNRALSASEVSKLAGVYVDAFSFTPQTAVSVSTLTESNAITVSGSGSSFPISISGGKYAISTDSGSTWGAWTNTSGTVSLGNMVKVRLKSSASGGTKSDATLTIGGVSAAFNVTTAGSAFFLNNDFESDPSGTVPPGITGWSFDFYTANDGDTIHGTGPNVVHQLNITTDRSYSGTKSVYSFIRNVGGGGGGDYNTRHATHDLRSTSFSTSSDTLYLWRSDVSYTTSSRYYWRLDVILSDGTNLSDISLACQDWGNSEGCAGNTYDNHDMTDIGADGQTWYRHPIVIPANLDRSKLAITIRHQQDSWDGTSAESTVYYDLVTDYGRDVIPDTFTFTPQTGVNRSTIVESNSITVSGITNPASISITGCTGTSCEYQIGSSTWTSSPGTVNNGDQVKVHQTSSSSYSTVTTLTLDIGGVTGDFNVTTKPIPVYQLSVTKAGSGAVTAVPDGGSDVLSWTGNTGTANFNEGTEVTLTATPNTGYTFYGWSGNLTGNVTPTTITMNAGMTITATFDDYTGTSCSNPPFKIGGTPYNYPTIKDAYNVLGNTETLQIRSLSFSEGQLNLDQGKSVTMSGGYDCDFITNTGSSTTVQGSVTISNGSVTVENLTVK
ncbi:MAG TPA: LamG-like jellyroll fold domain-containing protein, partial [Dissulfurispiraceae bacterium]|nr:LamG-like jellyroll fold domain-containing protein [Dissulfurispiraceae bacterium]